ncbi:2-amino-4-hydroxy-6-hydroxymethyldihydropteridine diphosphokinase [Paenibacillus sacheonensis]|uniref:2-amino-4-hydroxy-6-hydroxymethyldihydropteridine diphosphokinase n=1 Tax=Paenibacillus sacheonensis TaxID=742054 RepID=A0A7X4YVW5_9BACL|nr:2-amino-4-hydroxy-6-hydroxymethyldihydropteridine diphosphokinase [Paenibacillus sacheonensis]NBC73497.1 2-amino-4-hydroxy-6-hydroxymethyldihydropteridine diphosphokinase [Paenibacillus sacheonensis]
MEDNNPPINERLKEAYRVAYIALGSNVGDRAGLLQDALSLLDRHPDIQVLRVSSVYETEPVGYTDQPAFLNMAAALGTSLAPLQLLHAMLEMEGRLGRTRDIRWGPRTIDLDLLLYEAVELSGEELTLPHPRMMERAFVLVPLADVLEAMHPLYKQATDIAQRALQDRGEGIALWNTINWQGASAHSES